MVGGGPFTNEDGYVCTRGERAWSASDMAWKITHIFPIGDVIMHELDADCVCGPSVAVVPTTAAGLWDVLSHHSLA